MIILDTNLVSEPLKPKPDAAVLAWLDRQAPDTLYLTTIMLAELQAELSNGFSKKVENHAHALGLHYMYYSFGRIHKTLRVTPAMGAGVSDHVRTLEEIAKPAD